MKVNLGCGDRYAEGWVNVDSGSPHKMDFAVDLRSDLPWSELSITHAYAGHLLEHLTIDECRVLLSNLLPCMVYLGELMVVGPDVAVAQRMIDDGADMVGATMDSLRFGAGRWDGDVHRWGWTAIATEELLLDVGWTQVRTLHIDEVGPFWPVADRRPKWQRAVHARRAAS